jgi:AGZA family xanthine/uracil permease-like MFS transporter
MFFSPLIELIPPEATAPVLVIVGVFMAKALKQVNWEQMDEAIPAFLAFILIPLTYSITQGIIWGFLSYTAIKLLTGKWKDLNPTLLVIDCFAVLALVLL